MLKTKWNEDKLIDAIMIELIFEQNNNNNEN